MDEPLDGVAFTTGLTMRGSQIFGFWGVRQFFIFWLANVPECLYCRCTVKCSSLN